MKHRFALGALLTALVVSAAPAAEPTLELPPWTITVDASLSAGYRDNLLLSPSNQEKSTLLHAGVDAMLLRAPVGAWDGFLFLNLDEIRYLAGRDTDHERTAILATELRWKPSPSWKFGWAVQSYHQDQVIDVSITDATRATAQLKVTGVNTGPNVRWQLGSFFTEAKLTGRRDSYQDDLDGYDEGSGTLRFGYAITPRLELALAGTRASRDHSTRQQFTLGGRPLNGSHLRTGFEDAQFEAKQFLSADHRSYVTLALGRQLSWDNGSGYFNYNRDFARLSLHAKLGRWAHELSADYGRYVFPFQTVGVGLDPERRKKHDLRSSAEVTRQLTDALALLLVFQREQSRANDDRTSYTAHTFYLGVRWSWDSLDHLLQTP